MKLSKIIEILEEQTLRAKIVWDQSSGFLQISTSKNEIVWSGKNTDLDSEELYFEIIPVILEAE